MNTENSETDRSFCLKFFNKSWQLGLLVTLFSFGFFLAFANTVSAQTPIYRSVGPSQTQALASGTSNAMTISGTTATFASALPEILGNQVAVGDVIQYDSDGNGTIDSVAFIHAKISATEFTVANAAGGTPTAVTGDNDWSIFRAYTSLFNAERGVENTGVHADVRNFDDWTAGGDASTDDVGRDLVTNNEQWTIMAYGRGAVADTTAVTITGWTTSATNYLEVIGDNKTGWYSEQHYRIEVSVADSVVKINQAHIRLKYLQIKNSSNNENAIGFSSSNYPGQQWTGLVAWKGDGTSSGPGIELTYTSDVGGHGSVTNSILIGRWGTDGFAGAIYVRGESPNSQATAYNNLVVGAYDGVRIRGDYARIRNTAIINSINTSFHPLTSTGNLSYNAWNVGSGLGTNNVDLTSVDLNDVFVDYARNDYAIKASSPLAAAGIDLSSDNYTYPLDQDYFEKTRPSTPSIGPFEPVKYIYRSVAPGANAAQAVGTSNALTISGSTATFGSALPDNVRVGDAIQYDSDGNSTIDAIAFIHARTNSTTFTVANAAGGTPTAVTGDNDWSIFRAYTSLANAEDGTENTGIDAGVRNFDTWTGGRDLVANNERWVIMAYANGTTADTSATISGWTTGRHHFLEIIGDNNTGAWSDNHYKIAASAAFSQPFIVTNPYVRVSRLQVQNTASNGWGGFAVTTPTSFDDSYYIGNIVRNSLNNRAGFVLQSGSAIYANNISYGNTGAGFYHDWGNSWPNVKFINNVSYGNGGAGFSFNSTFQTTRLYQNNYSGGNTGDDYAITGTRITNASEDATGDGGLTSISPTAALTDPANGDFSLLTNSPLIDVGTTYDLVSTDIIGNNRPQGSAWDIGAFEAPTTIYRSVSPGVTTDLNTDNRTVTISGTTATFSDTMPGNVGVGDVLQYQNEGTYHLAFISGRTSGAVYTVQSSTGGAPLATSTAPVSVFRAYTSLANAEAGIENTGIDTSVRNFDDWTAGGDASTDDVGRDLVTNNEQWNITLYANGTTADVTPVTLNGWSTGRYNYLQIYTPTDPTEVGTSQRHGGVWDEDKYKMRVGGTSPQTALTINMGVDHVRIFGVQFDVSIQDRPASWDNPALNFSIDEAGRIDFAHNIVRYFGASTVSIARLSGLRFAPGNAIAVVYPIIRIWNNLFLNNTTGVNYQTGEGVGGEYRQHYGYLYNNTIVGFGTGISSGAGERIFYLRNNLLVDNLVATAGITAANSNYNATDLGSMGYTASANDRVSQTFSFENSAGGNYNLVPSDIGAKDYGVDLSTDPNLSFENDIGGVTRPSGTAWDIGAFEYDASGPTAIYRSVGPSATSALATGASNALTISGTTATFGSALPDNVGVGDAIQYDSDGNSTIDAIAFIHARTNSTTFTVANAAGGTPTAVTGDNDWSIFRAYTSLANAENGAENTGIDVGVRNFDTWTGGRDLVANNERWVIMAYANGTTADTTRVFIQDWVTSETNDLEIVGENNTGIWNDDYYRIVTTNMGDGDGVITVLQSYVYLRNLQIETPSTGAIRGIRQGDSESITGLRISHNIIRGPTGASHGITGRAGKVQIWNNVIIGWHHGIVFLNAFSGAESIAYNNTIIGSRDYGIHVYTPLQNPTLRLKNNIVQDAGVASYGIGFEGNPNVTTDYASNISSDNSSPNASFRNLTVAFVDANNGDYRLSSSDTSALDTGTNLSADPNLAFNTDIKGVTRPQGSEWDIGAHEGAVVILPTISGVIYIDEGQTTIGADRTVRVKVNGAGEYSGLTNSSGQYSINDVTISSAGDIVTVFLDGATEKAVTVTRAADNASNITGLNLYQNFVIVRHEDAGPITNTNLDQYDSGGDADIQFTVTGGNITVSSGNTLLVAGGKTYAPGGNITTPSLEVVGTLNSGANTLELSDSLGVSGSLTGSGNVTVSGGSATGDGAINLSGGTFLIDGDGNFGGNGNWAFNNLTFGDGSGFATTTASGSGPVTVEGIMTIATNQTLEAGSKTWNLHGSPAGGGGPSSLLLYVNFEEGPPAQSPYVLGATEHSAGSSNVELEFTFGGAINATGATVGNYGVQFGGFGSSIEIPVSNGDIFNKNSGRVGLWVKFGGGDDIPIFVADGSHLQLETRNNGVIRLRWNGNVILNSGDWGESMPTDRTPQFLEVRWDRANNIRAYRISTNSTEGTWRTNTDSWSEPPDATAVQLWGPYGIVYSDNWLISEDPDEDLWELRNMASYAEYGGGGEPANSLVVASGGSLISQSSTISFAPTGVNLEIPLMNYHNLELDVSGNTFNIPTGILNVGNNLSLVRGTLDLNTNDPNVSIGGNLTIASGSIFEASNSGTLSVSGNLINNGTFNHNGGTVTLTGSGASVVDSGSSMIFNNLTSTVAGKLLRFGAGRSFSVLGNLTITGSEGSPINIESSVPGRQWILALSAEQSSITHAVVKDSGCAPGSPVITLGTGMVNDGNNGTCWFRLSGAALEFFGGGGSSAGATSGGGSPAGGGGVTGGTPVDDGASGGGTPAEGGDSGGGGSASP